MSNRVRGGGIRFSDRTVLYKHLVHGPLRFLSEWNGLSKDQRRLEKAREDQEKSEKVRKDQRRSEK